MMSPWDAAVLAALVVLGATYARGMQRRRGRGGAVPRREPIAFALGWLALVGAVLPPIDRLAVELFSIHMVQHTLIMLIGAPLLIAGRPLPLLLEGVPPRVRRAAAGALQSGAGAALARTMTLPLLTWAAHGLVLWVWHVPALYEAAVAHEGVHLLQHAMFFGTSGLFWWGLVYGRYGRAGYGAAAFYVFTTVIHTGILGAAFTLAGSPLYPSYAAAAHAHGVDALADQQFAGLIMWVPSGFVLTLLGIALFAAWLGEAERRQRRRVAS
jgi:putative membrane protein